MYDLIGDIHGCANELKALLAKMDYREHHGVWRHPTRQVIFLGDFIDRGPAQVEVLEMVRAMVDAEQALTVMGNHEFNAVAWATPISPGANSYLRPHSEDNRRQHVQFLARVGEGSQVHDEWIDWFRGLPLWLDLPGLRVVHACWHQPSFKILTEHLDHGQRIRDETAWAALTREGDPAYEALETVLKGLEIPLPEGVEFKDKDGKIRRNVRTRWWKEHPITYRDLAIAPTAVIPQIPHEPAPEDILPGYNGDKPVFVGHYWMSGTPRPLSARVACLDYSVAAGGKLCAYRWDREHDLVDAQFCWVDVDRSQPATQRSVS
ncbi:metallophosphoesterase [Thiocapsa bogorovii]|uniref:metallophosphoesterase n=1 Tax=Thiocapsa bogorovii TaxID=521689 RepID=UPI001E609A2E|nr:metallophosphoesterase [Thiocapsa bogorovii]UHD18471.1 metallophosphoesterase [Thiocapsa bogorovii]